ncbi:RNA-directed DNA polymerase, eukaryota, Reverse transcriptase zinc-binding domain protein [Artemisia annua]|uniref:RNA-directed DNA polymerase, eukaryota, Reverse transcriptase zinc-binding domain protein n=1 Tax=Artemisia annua TaxID=35608 RepID=A0A2U1P1G7_ARTAN|nr:RNA-directed DNA polymerase, eukaryota, Reverse transcriptase zinc-binding domain protein [Artemisia annua]
MEFKVASWNIRGLGKLTKQNEIKNLIRNEKLSICAILETHMKKDKTNKICDKIFGNWVWQHNLNVSVKGCRIILGWNSDVTNCTLIHSTRQAMMYLIEVLSSNKKFFCTFIYAADSGRDRRDLWKDLVLFKQIINDEAWVLMGDGNVSLNLEDHSEVYDQCKLYEAINNNEWKCSNEWANRFVCLQNLNVPTLNDLTYKAMWITNDGGGGCEMDDDGGLVVTSVVDSTEGDNMMTDLWFVKVVDLIKS